MSDGRTKDYINKRRKLSGLFFETALPNEYLVEVGKRTVTPVLGGRRFRLFKKFLRVPGSVETLYFTTDNANVNYQGIGVEGYASWRIDPEHPEVAIATLDFFDEDDPMRDTNVKLTTICVEAVRHVIANMSIDDALKKKDEIGEDLKQQLKKFEQRWGILFDQVGIEKVRIMSEKLFEDLQSEYRDQLRLSVATAKIQTDRKISGEENAMREVTESEQMETERKLNLVKSENESTVARDKLEKQQELFEQQRVIKEDRYRKEAEFKVEQQESEYQTQMKEQRLKSELQDLETAVLRNEMEIEKIRNQIADGKLDVEERKRDINQEHTPEQLSHELIAALPNIYGALKIDNYSIMDTGGNGGISPISRVMQEVIGILRGNNLENLLRRPGNGDGGGDGNPDAGGGLPGRGGTGGGRPGTGGSSNTGGTGNAGGTAGSGPAAGSAPGGGSAPSGPSARNVTEVLSQEEIDQLLTAIATQSGPGSGSHPSRPGSPASVGREPSGSSDESVRLTEKEIENLMTSIALEGRGAGRGFKPQSLAPAGGAGKAGADDDEPTLVEEL
jgi:hypothetical protein